MKHSYIFVVIILLSTMTLLFGQVSQPTKQDLEKQVLKPTFIISDIYIVITILDGVDITGKEVDAFLDVKKHLNALLEQAKNKNLKVTDTIKVEIPVYVAQNTITFLNRASLRANMAEQYKRFVDAIVESSQINK